MGIGLISTYPPRRCGIASVAFHLRRALLEAGEPHVPVFALVKDLTDLQVGPEVAALIRYAHKEDYRRAAALINASPVDAVILEHEFSLFGGPSGSHVLELLSSLRKPVITVFHTVLSRPSPALRSMLRQIAAHSAVVVALCERARWLLATVYGIRAERVVHLPNGAPDPPDGSPEEWKERLGLGGRTVAMTFGLITPNKGIETMLQAVARVAPAHPELLYLVAGTTHPEEAKRRGERYRAELYAQVAALGIGNHVRFLDRYLSEEEVLQYLYASDLYVTPYLFKEQVSSATLAYAAFLGKALLSTPYDYAEELLGGGAGYLFPFGDNAMLAHGLKWLLDSPEARQSLGEAARARTRGFAWSALGHQYRQLARSLAGHPPPVAVDGNRPPEPGREHSLPAPPALRAAIQNATPSARFTPGLPAVLHLALHNTGGEPWPPETEVVADLFSARGRLLRPDLFRHRLDRVVEPGSAVRVAIPFQVPRAPGLQWLQIDLHHPAYGRLAGLGSQPLRIRLSASGAYRSMQRR